MAATPKKTLKIFYSYSHQDQSYRDQLERHLSNLKRLYNLQTWFDRQIKPGENWEEVLEQNLNTADLIFLLISPDFMHSNYCYNKEMARALERHTRGEAKVIPIIVRHVHWANAPFSHIQLLPTEAKPIKGWSDPDEAFYNIITEVEKVIQNLLISCGNIEEPTFSTNQESELPKYDFDEKMHLTAIQYLLSGDDKEAADILIACKLEILEETNDFGDEFHVADFAGPRNAYEILNDSDHPVTKRIRAALSAVLPREYYIRYVYARFGIMGINKADETYSER